MGDKTTGADFVPSVWSGEVQRFLMGPSVRSVFGIPEPEYLPRPWYGRLRNWMAVRVAWLAEWLEDVSARLWYAPRVKPGTGQWEGGDTIHISRLSDYGSVRFLDCCDQHD